MSNLSLFKKIDSAIRFFLYILIFWLPYSPAVVESCVVICLILWIFKRGIIAIGQSKSAKTFKEGVFQFLRDFKPESTFLNKPIVFFLLACVISVTNSAFFAQSLQNFFTKTLEWFIVYFLVVEVFKDKKHVYVALMVFMFTAFSTETSIRKMLLSKLHEKMSQSKTKLKKPKLTRHLNECEVFVSLK